MSNVAMKAAKARGTTDEEVHYEVSGAYFSGDPFSTNVVSDDRPITLDVGTEQTLLQGIRQAGFEVSNFCETRQRGTCRLYVLK